MGYKQIFHPPYPPYIPQLKTDITKALFSSGNMSDRIPVARGLHPDSPAAIIILRSTSCQYSVTAPLNMMAIPKTTVHMAKSFTLK